MRVAASSRTAHLAGVIQPFNTEWFSESAMRLLRLLVKKTDAVVVLSSAWRISKQYLAIAQERLALAGIEVRRRRLVVFHESVPHVSQYVVLCSPRSSAT
jgi:hypothetical protein